MHALKILIKSSGMFSIRVKIFSPRMTHSQEYNGRTRLYISCHLLLTCLLACKPDSTIMIKFFFEKVRQKDEKNERNLFDYAKESYMK